MQEVRRQHTPRLQVTHCLSCSCSSAKRQQAGAHSRSKKTTLWCRRVTHVLSHILPLLLLVQKDNKLAQNTLWCKKTTLWCWKINTGFKSYTAASPASHQDRMRRAKKVSGRTRLIDILYIRSHPGMSTLDRMYISHSHVFFISIKSTNLHLSLCMF